MNSPCSTMACLVTIVLLSLAGCDANPVAPGQGSAVNGPFGPPEKPAIMVPFEGDWTFNLEKTLEARKANGASSQEIEQARSMYSLMDAAGPELTITGTVMVYAWDVLEEEYRLFNLHKHGEIICGKAWHHEDRFDPGDMSKCRVQLKLQDDRLVFKNRFRSSPVDLNDPDLQQMRIVNTAAASTCDSDSLPDDPKSDWWPWEILVYDRHKTTSP